MKIIFLDIDGVLNGHDYNEAAKSCNIRPECVRHFNRILRETGAYVVISSAWRYMIYGGAITVTGFEYLLRTHGVECDGLIVGLTCKDEVPGYATRGAQIQQWLDAAKQEYPIGEKFDYLVLDDEEFDIAGQGHPLIRTNGKGGLDDLDAALAIQMLNAPSSPDPHAARHGASKDGVL